MQLKIIKAVETEWFPAQSWLAAGHPVCVLVLDGRGFVTGTGRVIGLEGCHALFVPVAALVHVRFEDARAIVFQSAEIQNADLPMNTPMVVDEVTTHVLLATFWNLTATSAHREAALLFACHHLKSTLPSEGSEPAPSEAAGTEEVVQRVMVFLETHLDEAVTLDLICETMQFSRTCLHQRFRQANLPSPMQMLARLRIQRATEWLQKTDLTVSQIAAAVGFVDLSAFSHFFRKHTGKSPSEFRDNFRWLL